MRRVCAFLAFYASVGSAEGLSTDVGPGECRDSFRENVIEFVDQGV